MGQSVRLEIPREEFQGLCSYGASRINKYGKEKGRLLLYGKIDKFLRGKGFDVEAGYWIDVGDIVKFTSFDDEEKKVGV